MPSVRGGELVAVLAADLHLADQPPADRALVRQPFLGIDRSRSRCPRCRRSTRNHRAPPGDHLLLHRHRAGRGGVDRRAQRGEVVRWRSASLRQLQHAHEMGRHPLAAVDLVAARSAPARPRRIEPLHHHDRAAQPLHGHRPAQAARRDRAAPGESRSCRVRAVQPVGQHREAVGASIAGPRAAPACTPLGRPVVPEE